MDKEINLPNRAVQAALTAASDKSGDSTWWAAKEMFGIDGLLNSACRWYSSDSQGGLSSLGGSWGGDSLGGRYELSSFFLSEGGNRLLIGLQRRSITRCFSLTLSKFGSDAENNGCIRYSKKDINRNTITRRN